MTYPPQAGAGQPPLSPQGQPAPGPQPWNEAGHPVLPAQQIHSPLPQQRYAAVPHPVLPMPYKDSTAAWLLWFFLGSFGAHHFYLGRTKWGVAYAVGFVLSCLFTIVLIGFLGLIALFVLWVVDATQMSQRLQQYNAHAYAVNRSLGVA
jgi:TM2 domain-containing membrane protein YozV